jgi:hypothetical protein
MELYNVAVACFVVMMMMMIIMMMMVMLSGEVHIVVDLPLFGTYHL